MSHMKIKHILEEVPLLHPRVSVLFRADHGIGKSSIAKQLCDIVSRATGIEYLFIDRRLSMMQAGDLMGLPEIDSASRTTRWNPPDWFKTACDQPCIVFLDELNRAELDVMNGGFQLILDHELAGFKLHPDTRVFAAVNTDSKYKVNQIDPALLDRFAVIDVIATKEDWVEWARSVGLHADYIDWIDLNPQWLNPAEDSDPESVQPTPRSNEACARAIAQLLEAGSSTGDYDHDRIRRIASMFIGSDASIALTTHLNAEFRYSGAMILEAYTTIRGRIKRHRIDIMQNALLKLCDELNANYEELGKRKGAAAVDRDQVSKHGNNIEALLRDMPSELRFEFFRRISRGGLASMPMIASCHPYFAPLTLEGLGVPMGQTGIGVVPNMLGFEKLIAEQKSA